MAITIKEASNTPLAIAALAKGMADSYVNYSGQRMQDKQYQQAHQLNLDTLAHSREMEERRMKELEINGAWNRNNTDTLTANTVKGTEAGILDANRRTDIAGNAQVETSRHNQAVEGIQQAVATETMENNDDRNALTESGQAETSRHNQEQERIAQETLKLKELDMLNTQQQSKDPEWLQKIDYAVKLAMSQAPGVDENQVRYAIGMHMLNLTQNNNNTITNESIMSLPFQQILGNAGIVSVQNGDKVSTGDAAVSVNGPNTLSSAALEKGSSQNNPIYPQNPAEYDAIPVGAWIVDKHGLRQKPADE